MMKKEQPWSEASWAARRAVWASPEFASMGGTFLEWAAPLWSHNMAAAAAKRGLMATS